MTSRGARYRMPALFITIVEAALLGCLAACASAPQPPAVPPLTDSELRAVRQAFARIDEQDRTVKRSPEWIKTAYQSLGIRHYRSLDAAARERLKPFVRNGEVFIIVHPAYYTFFMHNYDRPPLVADDPAPFPGLNLAERLRAALPRNQAGYRVMWEQERLIRDFLEYASIDRRLVILVLPHDYRTTAVYRSSRGRDEYVRFLNEVTNMADSTLYLESQTWDTGFLSSEEAANLRSFLSSVGVAKVLLGGGYVGKCLDNFYESLRAVYAYGDLAFVPELTTISPRDTAADKLNYLRSDGRLNMDAVRRYFNMVGLAVPGANEKMPLASFALYPVYQVR